MEYKKKPVKNTLKTKQKKKTPPVGNDDVVMKSYRQKGTDKRSNAPIKVIKGRRQEKRQRRMISAVAVCVVLLAIVIFSALTPTGPFEYLHNAFSSFGSGSYPAAISGSRFSDAYQQGSLMYLLTDTHAEVLNKSGKKLFSRQHEFNSPAISVSPQRALIFDRGGRSAFVFNNNDVLHSFELENEIYCADIGRNGTVAFGTKSSGYVSQVEVFDKNKKSKFIWYSSNDLVNNVAVSDNGKMVAVSTVNVSGGEYYSKVSVFNFSSADPVYTVEYSGSLIYSLDCVSGSSFAVAFDGGVDHISWKKGTKTECRSEYSLKIFRSRKNAFSLTVCGNKAGNIVTVYSKKAQKLASFEIASDITDITYCKEKVYILSDSYLYIYGLDGKQIGEKVNLSGYDRIFAYSDNSVIAVGNFGIDRIKVDKGE